MTAISKAVIDANIDTDILDPGSSPITKEELGVILKQIIESFYNIADIDLADLTSDQTIAGIKAFTNAIHANGGVDVETSGGTLNVGTTNAQNILIGGSNSIVTVPGTLVGAVSMNNIASPTIGAGGTVALDMTGYQMFNAKLTIDQNITLSLSGMNAGDYGTIIIDQDGTNFGNSVTLPSNSKVINGGALNVSQGAGERTILTFFYDGADFNWNYGGNYS